VRHARSGHGRLDELTAEHLDAFLGRASPTMQRASSHGSAATRDAGSPVRCSTPWAASAVASDRASTLRAVIGERPAPWISG
jgi:hypothetical protein